MFFITNNGRNVSYFETKNGVFLKIKTHKAAYLFLEWVGFNNVEIKPFKTFIMPGFKYLTVYMGKDVMQAESAKNYILENL